MLDKSERPISLPPGFMVRQAGDDLWREALESAQADEPGTVIWDGSGGRCRAAFLFAPDRAIDATVLLDLGLLALFEAVARLAPPQSPVTIVPPDALLVDGGRVATLRAAAAPGPVPDWAVLMLDIAVDVQDPAPGERPEQTCLAEEGFGPVTPADVLEAVSRHLLGWIDIWCHEGAATLARTVQQRTSSVALAL